VPDGKLERYADFNKHCLKPALDEVNHIMDFIVDVMAVKKGRAVEKLVLSWFRKSPAEMRRAYDEREKSRVGRQVRWNGSVELNSTPSWQTFRMVDCRPRYAACHGQNCSVEDADRS
jgi:plasmid replication initiation protein